MNIKRLTKKKEELERHRPLPSELVRSLAEWFRIELTYTSNAIEGNTLSRRETALVVEKGTTVGGKSLIEHLEATNHAKAFEWVQEQMKRKPQQIKLADILHIHEMILKGIDDENAGHFRSSSVRIAGSTVVLPNPRKVPDLMDELITWLKRTKKLKLHPAEIAAEAHYQLVTIHPFVDGNGRTARLLMNMILMMEGYPPAIIRKRDRLAYLSALEKVQTGGAKDTYEKLIENAIHRSFDIYLRALRGEEKGLAQELDQEGLMKIGELAKKVGETVPTIRYWTKEGLLEVEELTESGYQHYSPAMVERVKEIQALKKRRLTIKEIKEGLFE